MNGRRIGAVKCFALFLGSMLVASSAAFGQATRTWISGVGDDANPCSRTAPCKTFQGAISKTATGGEISVLDPGGYGALTITKSITLSGDGELASILVSGQNGILVNANPGDVVIIRDLEITGIGGAGVNGIRVIGGGDVHVDRVRIFGFGQWGIDAAMGTSGPPTVGHLYVNDSTFRDNTSGAIFLDPSSSSAMTASIDRVVMAGNGRGVVAYEGVNATIENSTISVCTINSGILSYGATRYSDVAVRNSSITGCSSGVFANNYARVRLSNTLITNNTTGLQAAGAGLIQSFGNNQVYGNGTDGMPTSTISPM